MPTIITIVEGDGEVQAVPTLIRRIAEVVTPGSFPEVPKPIRVRRDGSSLLAPLRGSLDAIPTVKGSHPLAPRIRRGP